jgi:hypothetical protein
MTAKASADLLEQWRDPVFSERHGRVPPLPGWHPDQVVAIGKRMIRRTGWLEHL